MEKCQVNREAVLQDREPPPHATPIALLGGTGLVDAAGQKLVNKITGENKPINYNRDAMFFTQASGTIRGTVAQNIADATGVIDFDEEKHPVLSRLLNGKSLADVYQLGMGMQDSAAVAALTVINPVLGKVGAALLGGAAGTQAMLDAAERGATDEQALTMGILSGAFEMLFEKYELDSLLGQGKNFWQAFWKQGLSETVGEGATEAANILADIAVMAEKSDWQQNIRRYLSENPDWDYNQAAKQAFIDAALQVGEASVGGWISGSTMGGGYSGIQNIADNVQKNQQAYDLYGETQQELVTEALELNPNNAYAQKLQGKLDSNKQLSGAQLRKLAAQNESVIQNDDMQNVPTSQIDKVSQNATARNVGQVNASVSQEDVAKSLRSKGISSKKADGIAEAIVARLNGQELTRTQRDLLSFELGSPAVQNVISELIKKKADGIDSVQKRMYDGGNISGFDNGEEAARWDLPNQRADAFGDNDYATVTEDSVPHQVWNTFSEGIRGVGTDTVTYRRVQGGGGNNASQVRIKVNADGSSSIPNKEANLSISIDGGEHAEYFLNKRGGDAQIIEIDVPKWFDDFLQENAIPQVNYKTNPRNQGGAAPKITDITTPGNCFELPAPWIEWLEEYGRNARIVNP